jgi:hypothetical protein
MTEGIDVAASRSELRPPRLSLPMPMSPIT